MKLFGLSASGNVAAALFIGSYMYYKKEYRNKVKEILPLFDDSLLSNYAKSYIKNNELVHPFFTHLYQDGPLIPTFLEGTIVREMDCLDFFQFYLKDDYQEALLKKRKLTDEERKKLYESGELYSIFVPNKNIEPVLGMAQQGFIATLADSMGAYLTFTVDDFLPPFTAELNLTHHAPMDVGKEYICRTRIEKIEGRKIFTSAKVYDTDGNVYNDIEALYVKMDWNYWFVKEFFKILSGYRYRQIYDRLNKKRPPVSH